ncbi:MAG: cell division protein FtsW [Lachnospiraceae bacterium]|nr:cell division protein FtsW [Lachnospiraceae bacterium]
MAESFSRRKKKTEYYFDYSLVFIIIFLVGFGLIMLYSSSSYMASQKYNDAAYWLKRQGIWSALGIGVMLVLSFIPYHFWERFSTIAYFVSMALIPCVLFFPKRNGARRWIFIGPNDRFSLQPAEIAKLCLILFLASFITRLGPAIRSRKGFWTVILMALPHTAMIYFITDNLSSAIIIMGITAVMLFVASPEYKRFIILAAGVLAAGALVVLIVTRFSDKLGFRGARILAWLDPEAYASDTGFQTLQGLYAIGSGGIWGKGLGQSIQKLGYIPEAQNDMIFSIICEELGLFGAIAILLMFVLLVWRLVVIANNATDMFGALFVVGVLGHVAIQVILNVAVVTNTVPNTGISLPFISYGGSAILFQMAEIGVCLNVARSIELKDA